MGAASFLLAVPGLGFGAVDFVLNLPWVHVEFGGVLGLALWGSRFWACGVLGAWDWGFSKSTVCWVRPKP